MIPVMCSNECLDLFLAPLRLGKPGRTYDDQELGVIKRNGYRIRKIAGKRKLGLITKDPLDLLFCGRELFCNRRGHPVALEFFMKVFRYERIKLTVSVAYERIISDILKCH